MIALSVSIYFYTLAEGMNYLISSFNTKYPSTYHIVIVSLDNALYRFNKLFLVVLFHSITRFIIHCMYKKNILYKLLHLFFRLRYRIKTIGLSAIPTQGPVLLLGNHISWIDWAIIQIASPRPIRFVMDKGIYTHWFLHPFLKQFNIIPITSAGSKEAILAVNQALKSGDLVCLFPEGAISKNGQLGQFKKGFERCIADIDNAIIIPFYLHGLWGSRFSYASSKTQRLSRQGLRRTIIVSIGAAQSYDSKASTVKQAVLAATIPAWQTHMAEQPDIGLAFIRRAKQFGGHTGLIDLATHSKLSYRRVLVACLLFSQHMARQSAQNIGILLPTSPISLIVNMAGLIAGKTIVNLNYTASHDNLKQAIAQADIQTIYTSQRFIDTLQKKHIDLAFLFDLAQPCFVETLKQQISTTQQRLTFLTSFLPAHYLYHRFGKRHNGIAAILFSSGSEGSPKGVQLSHQNLYANIQQVSAIMNPEATDKIVAILPTFHAFGLTVTSLLPLLQAVPAICYPDPTDVNRIAQGIHRYQATILCATSTLLRLFNQSKRVDPLMLSAIKKTIAGAEKLHPHVRQQYLLKFGQLIYEGYGATETSPVATVNTTDHLAIKDNHKQQGHKEGSVGLPLPGSHIRIVSPETLAPLPIGQDGLILVGGVQVMQGYLSEPEKTEQSLHCQSDITWYHTGDKGHIDEDGFLTIIDRYSRFAKIGGEMISLTALENTLSAHIPEQVEIICVAIPDTRKGEKLILLYTGTTDLQQIQASLKKSTLTPLSWPSHYHAIATIPKLGSGKTDFHQAKQIALAQFATT